MIDSWADWCLCWLVIPQFFSPETLQWIPWLEMTSTAKSPPPPTGACAAPGLGGFTLVQVATSYPSLCCVNRIISAEISPPLHWTAHHCPAAKIRWERIHIPPPPPPQPRRNRRWMEGWTLRIYHRNRPDLRVFEIEILWTDWRW